MQIGVDVVQGGLRRVHTHHHGVADAVQTVRQTHRR